MGTKASYEDLKIRALELEKESLKRRLAENALREREKRLNTLIEITSDWVWEVDLNGVYTYTSMKVRDIMGYDADEIIGTVYYEYLEGEEKVRQIASFFDKTRKAKPFSGWQFTQLSKDGRQVIMEVNATPTYNSDGKFAGWIGFNRDITDKVLAERSLKQREKELEIKSNDLQEVNAALKVLLKQREEDKSELEAKVVANVKQLVEPYLEQLKMSKLLPAQKTYLNIIQSNLEEIISPFVTKLSSRCSNLTPAEIKVMNLIKHGSSTKEIAELLGLSWQTIEFQRKHIRKKLGITHKKKIFVPTSNTPLTGK
ncbi:Transcriptional regulator, PAS domain linked with LysR-type HTH domain [uncultured Desulfobacterium sp.]|uniref:Transcriptional regulator, PAS domain linked with LysR-type HTH domain n=1 Tax=uncultured Desulfobacterium sp. TaxID=201089 RepID=A0A445MTB3_9BACT|nr:Transcriptional regulator, PAS domain linked with LysR-type HTH domain [uncultured Desulfobacterium sp.]